MRRQQLHGCALRRISIVKRRWIAAYKLSKKSYLHIWTLCGLTNNDLLQINF